MRPVALAGHVATGSVSWAQDADTGLCSTAPPASVGTLATVVEACGRTIQRQSVTIGRRCCATGASPCRGAGTSQLHRTDDVATKLIHDA